MHTLSVSAVRAEKRIFGISFVQNFAVMDTENRKKKDWNKLRKVTSTLQFNADKLTWTWALWAECVCVRFFRRSKHLWQTLLSVESRALNRSLLFLVVFSLIREWMLASVCSSLFSVRFAQSKYGVKWVHTSTVYTKSIQKTQQQCEQWTNTRSERKKLNDRLHSRFQFWLLVAGARNAWFSASHDSSSDALSCPFDIYAELESSITRVWPFNCVSNLCFCTIEFERAIQSICFLLFRTQANHAAIHKSPSINIIYTNKFAEMLVVLDAHTIRAISGQ